MMAGGNSLWGCKMLWRDLFQLRYSPTSSSLRRHGARRCGGATMSSDMIAREEDRRRGEGHMKEYRKFVEDVANGSRAGEVILNRSPDHAAVVIEFLFRKAESYVHILTRRMSEEVYSKQGILDAAVEFLGAHPAATISILAEEPINRSLHPFFVAVDRIFKERVRLRFVAPAKVHTYNFNFAVADGRSYRFEESRDSREAVIQFGDEEFGEKLEATFEELSSTASEAREH
jgi:hypothetical protein